MLDEHQQRMQELDATFVRKSQELESQHQTRMQELEEQQKQRQQQQQQQQQREKQECQHQKRKKGKPEGWHSRRHQFPPELGGGRGSQPNPTRTQRNKAHKAKREENARAAGKPTRSELRGPKRIAYAASCESNAAQSAAQQPEQQEQQSGNYSQGWQDGGWNKSQKDWNQGWSQQTDDWSQNRDSWKQKEDWNQSGEEWSQRRDTPRTDGSSGQGCRKTQLLRGPKVQLQDSAHSNQRVLRQRGHCPRPKVSVRSEQVRVGSC